MICKDCNKVIHTEYSNVGICPFCLDIDETMDDNEDLEELLICFDMEEDYDDE